MNDRLADPLDEATALTATMTAHAVAAARAANSPQYHPDFDGESCIQCGDEIPQDRLAMGKIRCVACQSALEKSDGRRKSVWQGDWLS